jgi:hypothetical protein
MPGEQRRLYRLLLPGTSKSVLSERLGKQCQQREEGKDQHGTHTASIRVHPEFCPQSIWAAIRQWESITMA